MNWETLYLFSIASALLAFAPGPDNIFVMVQSMVHGFKSGVITTLGLISGCIVHTSLVAFGVSAMIQQSYTAFTILKFAGALYLLFLAFKVYRSKQEIQLDVSSNPKKSYASLYRQGFLMNVLNPKVAVFYLALFPGFLFSESLDPATQFYILGLLFMCIALIVFVGLAFLAGKIAHFVQGHPGASLLLKWMQIMVFIGIAIFIIL